MNGRRRTDLDIVITTYNSADCIQRCLESLSLIEASWSLFIVDNGSSDQTVEIVRRVAPRATIISNAENTGFGQGINRGVAAGSADLVLVLNPDAVIVSDIAPVIARVRARDVIAAGLMLGSSGQLRSNAFRFPSWTTAFRVSKAHIPPSELLARFSSSDAVTVDYVEGSFFVIRRSSWEMIGGFSPEYFMYGEDRDLCRRALDVGIETELVNAAVFQHAGGFSPRRQPWHVTGMLLYTHRYHRPRFWAVWAILMAKFVLKAAVSALRGDRERFGASRATLAVLLRWRRPQPPKERPRAEGPRPAREASLRPEEPSASVSVILPTYNRARTIRRACESVLSQGDAVLELIVVDDGSTDETAQIVAELARGDARVRYVQRRHAGACAARNHGIAIARGQLIAFQDSDDEWLPGKLDAQLRARGATASLVYTAHRVIFRDGQEEIRPAAGAPLTRRRLLAHNFISTQTVLVDRALLGANRFDPRLRRLQDWDLWLSLAEDSGLPMRAVLEPYVNLYRQEDSVTNSQEDYYHSLAVILRKHAALYLGNPWAGVRVVSRIVRHRIASTSGIRGRGGKSRRRFPSAP